MNTAKIEILNEIKDSGRIFIFRHIRCDGDCIGSTKGLKRILELTYPEKDIRIIDGQRSGYLAFLGHDTDDATDEECKDALALVLDTGSSDRIYNEKYKLCKKVLKIDHHIERDPYGDICWVEEERTSTCEMITDFYDSFKDELVMDTAAATYLFAGMVTDSGRFRFRSVSGETMRLAGLLLDKGVDTDTLYANLYIVDIEDLQYKSYVYKKMSVMPNGTVYITISKAVQEKFGLSSEEACNVISYLEGIRGSLIWLAFIENPDGSYRVRLRSRFVTVSELAEKYGGGGHACAAGASVKNKKEIKLLIADADKLLGEYKENNEGWL